MQLARELNYDLKYEHCLKQFVTQIYKSSLFCSVFSIIKQQQQQHEHGDVIKDWTVII